MYISCVPGIPVPEGMLGCRQSVGPEQGLMRTVLHSLAGTQSGHQRGSVEHPGRLRKRISSSRKHLIPLLK